MKKRQHLFVLALCLIASLQPAYAQTVSLATPTVKPTALTYFQEGDLLYVVNKQNRLTSQYIPDDLVTPLVKTRKESLQDGIQLRKEAAEKLTEMFRAADIEKGLVLYAVSGYRSYGIQQINFNSKLNEVGSRDKAMRSVAPAGASEHQLGLVMDIQSKNFLNLNQNFATTEEGLWLADNAHRFGFILRYKKEWQDVTGFIFEPWHFRYVGLAHAKAMHKLQIPLETYVEYISRLPRYVVEGGSDILLSGLVGDMMAGNVSRASYLISQASGSTEQALREASATYLPAGMTYEQALWACYPTPRPTSAPRIDADEEITLFPSGMR